MFLQIDSLTLPKLNFNVFKKFMTFALAYEKHTSLEFLKHSTIPKLKSKF